jgi:hypothetical protein
MKYAKRPNCNIWLIGVLSVADSPLLHTAKVDKSSKEAGDLLSFTVLSSTPNAQECIATIPGKRRSGREAE